MARDCNDQVQDDSTHHFLDLQKLHSWSELLRPEQATMIIKSDTGNKTGPKTSPIKSHIKLITSIFFLFFTEKHPVYNGYINY